MSRKATVLRNPPLHLICRTFSKRTGLYQITALDEEHPLMLPFHGLVPLILEKITQNIESGAIDPLAGLEIIKEVGTATFGKSAILGDAYVYQTVPGVGPDVIISFFPWETQKNFERTNQAVLEVMAIA